MQPAMEDMVRLPMEVITGPPSWVPTGVTQVVDISNRTGQDMMKNSHLELMLLATEDTTLGLMVLTGAIMVMEEIIMLGVEIGKLVIQMEKGETRVLDTVVGEEEASTAQREKKVELEPWKN